MSQQTELDLYNDKLKGICEKHGVFFAPVKEIPKTPTNKSYFNTTNLAGQELKQAEVKA